LPLGEKKWGKEKGKGKEERKMKKN